MLDIEFMKAIVTGGAGFIGSHLVDLLMRKKHQVIVLDNLSTGKKENIKKWLSHSNFSFYKTDISNYQKIKKYFKGVDWVFHLAGKAEIVPSINDPLSYFQTNVLGTISVLEASRKENIKKFIYAASSSCYGLAKTFPTPEDAPINPEYPYALTKYLGEVLCLYYYKIYKLPVISLRLFNVYGPRVRASNSYGAFMGKTKWALGETKGYYLEEDGKLVSTRKYDKSMVVRLHFFDGREWQLENKPDSYVPYLDHFRLVYESKTKVSPSYFADERDKKNTEVRLIKVFEYVKGAKIVGQAKDGQKIEIVTKVTTNQGREFIYSKSEIAKNGQFEIIVPYSTEGKNGWLKNGTKFEVFASPYLLKIGNKTITVDVKEEAVVKGLTINIKNF